jgi:hypothetical protein
MRSQLSGSDLAGFRAKLRNLLGVPVGAARAGQLAGGEKKAKPAG